MRLIIESEDTSVVAVDDLEQLLEPATGGVAIPNVGAVLRGIRVAASAIRTPVPTPGRLEAMAAVIFAGAGHARALAEKAPRDDDDAASVLAMLDGLGL